MVLSVVIPAHNEQDGIAETATRLHTQLAKENIEHEILIINDNSTDGTEQVLVDLAKKHESIRYLNNLPPHGFGSAIRKGLDHYQGEAVAVYMADGSDRPEDLVRFYRTMLQQKVDCVFGTRFHSEAHVIDYPWPKKILNRMANTFIQILFGLGYNDVTNAFKLYHRRVIDGAQPLLSQHFNLTVELPLKAIVRGFSYSIVPNDWINRKTGESKLKIREMGSRYLFIILYCFLEKWLSRGDYYRANQVLEQN